MKERYIVLRSPLAATRDPFSAPLATFASFTIPEVHAANLLVDTQDLSPKEVPGVARSADVLALAPAIPMRLIAPKDVPFPSEPQNTLVAWGIKAVEADTSPFTGEGIVVAVLDTGIDASHPAFIGIELVQRDFTGQGNGDTVGHGTHCAGTIFGRDVEGQRIGVARGVKKALIGKVINVNGGSSEGIVSAIQWAVENGANVISMSLGLDFPGFEKQLRAKGLPDELATSRALEGYRANVVLFERMAGLVQALGAFSRAAIIVAAAGNESRRDENPDFEIGVSPPAVADGIISVAALGQSPTGLTVAPFSNTGASVAGPGVGIVSAKAGGGLTTMSGTSMATPHVAGVAALWAEKINSQGSLNNSSLTARLVGTAGYSALKQGFDITDVGRGLVRAPQEQ